MGTGARAGRKGWENNEKHATPGPGSYNVGNTGAQDAGASTWGTSHRGSQFVSKNELNLPGPGAYNQDRDLVMYRSQSVVIAPKSAKGRTRKGSGVPGLEPGPGHYDVSGTGSKTLYNGFRGAKMAGRPKERAKESTPGPGSYAYQTPVDRDSSPGAAFAKEARFRAARIGRTPDPGSYNLSRNISAGRGVKLHAKLVPNVRYKASRNNDQAQTPGPGAYHNSDVKQGYSNPSAGFASTVARGPKARDVSPGPGQYSNATASTLGRGGVMAGKGPKLERDASPGPGHYTSQH